MNFSEFVKKFEADNYERSRRFAPGRFDPAAAKRALASIGDPQLSYKTIHIAGTSGKGSTATYLARMLAKEGYKTGLYKSPHLLSLGERIAVNENPIAENEFSSLSRELMAQNLEGCSFFDWLTIIAFEYFKRKRVDWAVIETGLGGRLDSTNNLEPQFCVITTIGMDHVKLLGPTLGDIAREKGGIMKARGVVYSYDQAGEAARSLEKEAAKISAKLLFLEEELPLGEAGPTQAGPTQADPKQAGQIGEPSDIRQVNLNYCKNIFKKHFRKNPPEIDIDLPGVMEEFELNPASGSFIKAIKNLGQTVDSEKEDNARRQPSAKTGRFYFDGAHNDVALQSMLKFLKAKGGLWNIYFNILKERNIEEFIQILRDAAKERSPNDNFSVALFLLDFSDPDFLEKGFHTMAAQRELGQSEPTQVELENLERVASLQDLQERLGEGGNHIITGSTRLYFIAKTLGKPTKLSN